jgi:hypothetical protein
MIDIEGKIVSLDVLEEKFVCDLNACKGICCVEGDSGAPLDENEIHVLENILEDVKPYMEPDGIAAVEKQGAWVIDTDGDYVTPLVEGKQCAYVYFEKGFALCAIEKAWKEKKVDYQKPISCHLYPIRIKEYKRFDALNYDRWEVCAPACSCGKKLKVPVYKFVKGALIRKYGEDWYSQLEEAAALVEEERRKE